MVHGLYSGRNMTGMAFAATWSATLQMPLQLMRPLQQSERMH